MKINAIHIHNKACSTALMMLCCMVFFSCVEVDLCEESSHDHLSSVKLIYHWPDSIEDERPDSMFAFFNCFTSTHRIGYITDSVTSVGGRYRFGKPKRLKTDSLMATAGDYRVFAFNNNLVSVAEDSLDENTVADFRFENFDNFFSEENQSKTNLRDLYVSYIAHEITDSCLSPYGKNWSSVNPEFKYIPSNIKPIYCAESKYNESTQSYSYTFNVQKDNKIEVHLYPQKVTQDITISFPIYTEYVESSNSDNQLHIDSIIAEISGIPHKMCIYDRTLMDDIIYKMLFKMNVDVENAKDTVLIVNSVAKTFKEVECKSTISVMGLLANAKNTSYGAGILQLCIYLGDKVYHAKINMYNTINKANLVIKDDLGRNVQNPGIYPERPFNSTLRIDDSFLVITRDFVLNTLNGESSLDSWFGDKDGDGEIDDDHKLDIEI